MKLSKLPNIFHRRNFSFRIKIYLASLRLFGVNVVYNRSKAATNSKLFNVLYITESPAYAESVGWYRYSDTFDLEVSFRTGSDAKSHIGLGALYSLVDVFSHYKSRSQVIESTRVSNIALTLSNKKFLPGHKLRHEIYEHYKHDKLFSFFGGGAGQPISDLGEIYLSHKFVLAVENEIVEGYNSEKVFDVILSGAVPLYFGSESSLLQYGFDAEGIIFIKSLEDVKKHAERIRTSGNVIYEEMLESVHRNLAIAHNLRSSLRDNFFMSLLVPIMIRQNHQFLVKREDWDRQFET